MRLFSAISVIFGLAVWYLSGNELGFAVGVGCFWCGAVASSALGMCKKISKDSIL